MCKVHANLHSPICRRKLLTIRHIHSLERLATPCLLVWRGKGLAIASRLAFPFTALPRLIIASPNPSRKTHSSGFYFPSCVAHRQDENQAIEIPVFSTVPDS